MSLGPLFGVAAYSIFGIVPVYYKILDNVPAVQIALHRFTWTFPETMLIVILLGQTKSFAKQAFTKTNFLLYAGSAGAIGASTVLLIWAVNAGYLLEVSLGAFLNPITMVVIGVGLLKEKLRRWQIVSVGLAAVGVGIFAIAYGILFPFCAIGTILLETQHTGVFTHVNLQTDLLLIGNGVMTIVPVILLVAATQITPLYVMGLISNISPTIQFLLGVLVYHEPFSTTKLVGFIFLWVSMGVFALDSFWAYKANQSMKEIPFIATPLGDYDAEKGFEYVDSKSRTLNLLDTSEIKK